MRVEGVPDGDCARVAMTLAQSLEITGEVDLIGAGGDQPITEVRVCHGRPVAREGVAVGRHYFHAWVEAHIGGIGAVVLDWSNGLPQIAIKRTTYYRLGSIDPDKVDRYPLDDAVQLMLSWGTYGPWVAGPHLEDVPA